MIDMFTFLSLDISAFENIYVAFCVASYVRYLTPEDNRFAIVKSCLLIHSCG